MHATDLILHILHCEKLVKTQLGFLVYLVDREWVQRTGQSLTGFTYRKSRNRPRAEEFDDALRDLEDSNAVTVFEGTNQFGTAYKLYEARPRCRRDHRCDVTSRGGKDSRTV